MDNKALLLRCKTKSGQHVLNSLTSGSTVDDLLSQLTKATGISIDCMKILQGYPPKTLDITQGSVSLTDIPIRSGDTLIVEEMAEKPVSETNQVPREDDVLNKVNISVPEVPGMLMRKVVPANNSCLFTSIHYIMTNGNFDMSIATELRKLIVKTVAEDPTSYNEAFLGKSNSEYCKWIQNDQTWGGAIEVAILSKHYQVEIVVVDTQHVRLNRFGEDFNYNNRVLLIYDGIHYDPLHMEMFDSESTVQTMFLCDDHVILQMALELAKEAKHSRQFTDVNNFQLRCLECNKPLTGQIEAQQHAKVTSHTNFGEV